MLKIGIVGCGRISAVHIWGIDQASGTKVHPHYPDVHEGGKSQIIVDAIQQSATEKRVVEL